MLLDVAEFAQEKGRFTVLGATPDRIARLAPDECDGVVTRWFDEAENPDLCAALMGGGRFWFDQEGRLWQDVNWRAPAPGVKALPEKPVECAIEPARDLYAEINDANSLDEVKLVLTEMLDRQAQPTHIRRTEEPQP